MSIAAIILAAGRAARFGAGAEDSKVLARIDGVSLLAHVAKAAATSRASPIVAVIGHASEKVRAELQKFDFTIVVNNDLDLGLSHSLRLGLASIPATASGVIVLLADMPFITPEIIDSLLLAYEQAHPAPLAVIPVHWRTRGNPVLLSRAIFSKIEKLTGDRGARFVLDQMPYGVLEAQIDSEAISLDIDTREMLDRAAKGG